MSCSSTFVTSRSVEAMCWASTARHRRRRARSASDPTARRVQVLDDTNQAFCAADEVDRAADEPLIGSVQPAASRRIVGTDQGVERAEQSYEQGAKLPFLLLGVQGI